MPGNQASDEIEALLSRHYTAAPPGEQFAQALEDDLKREQLRLAVGRQRETVAVSFGAQKRHTFGLRRRRGLRREVLATVGVAACLGGAVVAYAMLHYERDLPRDQVLATIRQARAMHVVCLQQFADGSWKEQEVWYRRGGSLIEICYLDGRSDVLVDDGRTAWEYDPADLLRGPTYDSAVKVATLAKALGIEWIGPSLTREPGADRCIYGDWCTAYRAMSRGGTWRARVWIDESKYVRRCETSRLRNEAWTPVRIAQVHYDMPMDGFRLFGDVDAMPEILDTAKPLDARFDLNKAQFTRQLGETIFAVHKVMPCEDDLVFLVCSARSIGRDLGVGAADATGAPPSLPGQFAVSFDWQPTVTRTRHAVPLLSWELLRMNRDGLQLAWYVLRVQRSELTASAGNINSGYLRLEVTVAPTESTDQSPDGTSFETVMKLPPATEVVPLAHIVARVYSDPLIAGALFSASPPQMHQATPSGVSAPLSSAAMPARLASLWFDEQHCPGMPRLPARTVPNVDGWLLATEGAASIAVVSPVGLQGTSINTESWVRAMIGRDRDGRAAWRRR